MRATRAPSLTICLVLAALASLALAAGLGACGGSSSESPWPVEPDSPVLGPAGEDGKSQSSDGIPDAGPDASSGPNVAP